MLPVTAASIAVAYGLCGLVMAALRVDQPGVADQGGSAVGKMGGQAQPALVIGLVEWGDAGAVLVVAAGELDVVEDDPVVRREDLGQSTEPGQEVGLVDRADSARPGEMVSLGDGW